MCNIMKEFDMLLPTVRQADMIKLALDDGYIYYHSHRDIKQCCKMGWLSLQEGGRFYPTLQGKLVVETLASASSNAQ